MRITRLRSATLVFALLAGFPVHSQAVVASDGAVSIDAREAGNAISGDIAVSYGGEAVGGRVGLGFDRDASEREGLYGSIGIETERLRADFGRPRSIYDDDLAVGRRDLVGPLLPRASGGAVQEAVLDNRDVYGLQLRATGGGLSYGLSVHRVDDAPVLGIAGRYVSAAVPGADAVVVYAGAEQADADERYRLGTEVTRGVATAGLGVEMRRTVDPVTVSQLYLDVEVVEGVTLGLSGSRERAEASRTDRLGVNAAYRAGSGAFLSGGVTSRVEAAELSDPALGLIVGFSF